MNLLSLNIFSNQQYIKSRFFNTTAYDVNHINYYNLYMKTLKSIRRTYPLIREKC